MLFKARYVNSMAFISNICRRLEDFLGKILLLGPPLMAIGAQKETVEMVILIDVPESVVEIALLVKV